MIDLDELEQRARSLGQHDSRGVVARHQLRIARDAIRRAEEALADESAVRSTDAAHKMRLVFLPRS